MVSTLVPRHRITGTRLAWSSRQQWACVRRLEGPPVGRKTFARRGIAGEGRPGGAGGRGIRPWGSEVERVPKARRATDVRGDRRDD